MTEQRVNNLLCGLIKVIIYTIAVFTTFGGMTGCAKKGPALYTKITFNILAEDKVNNSKSLHLVIRKVSKKKFIIEDYDEIADLIYTEPPDKSLLVYHVIVPGREDEIEVEVPLDSNIGIYGMFLEPDENWKVMLQHPMGKEYDIIVENNYLKLIDKEKQSLWEKVKGTF